jgi:hypothetical protein
MWQDILEFCKWLGTTQLSHDMAGGWKWGWPTCETLHFIGLSLLLGCIGVVDLRMLGFAKSMPGGPIHKLVPWAIVGFIINAVTGVLFFIGAPFQYVKNVAFLFKMIFLVIAGINILLFYSTGMLKRVEAIGPGEDAPMGAKVISAVSIISWIMVLYWGRMLPFVGNAF